MKRYLILSILICIGIVGFSQNMEGDSWTKVKTSGAGTMAVLYATEPGIISKDADGTIKGVCADILADFVAFVETKHGKKITVRYVKDEADFPVFLRTVQTTNNLLGVSNTSITDERKKTLKFTPPYLRNIAVLLTNQTSPAIKTLDQLKTTHAGFSAEILKGSTHEQTIEKIKKEVAPNLKINYSASNESIFKTLTSNPKTFTILDVTAYVGLMNEKKYPIKRQEVNLKIVDEIGFIMAKSSDWDKVWEEFLTPEYRNSIRYKQIISKNLGASFFSLTK